METPTTATDIRSQRWRWRLLIAGGVGVVAIHALVILYRRMYHSGDFDVSREFGRRFLAGEYLYAGGLHYPYMPSAAMFFSPLALVQPALGFVLRYAAALACLWLTLRLLETMMREGSLAIVNRRWSIGVWTLVLSSPYLIRDLDDGGPHLILLGFATLGIYAAWKRRDAAAAGWFGLVTAIKAPAVLFVAFFLWKRRWRLAVFTVLASAAWITLPAVWMGPASWWGHQRDWWRAVEGSVWGAPVGGAAASERRVQNQALRPALLRYLAPATQEPPHPLAFFGRPPVINFPFPVANGLAMAACVLVVGLGAWSARGSRSPPATAWPLECSAVLLLSVLLAPVAWLQHFVVLVPAVYVIMAEHYGGAPLGRQAAAALAVYVVLALVLNRELVGRAWSLELLAAGAHTACLLVVLGLLLCRRRTAVSQPMP